MSDPRILVLAATDNVATAIQDIPAGAIIELPGAGAGTGVPAATIVAANPITLGHKIAIRAIPTGQKIIKLGAPIGSATRDIAPGEHVHTHNIKSDYLPSFGRDGSSRMAH